MLLTIGIRDTRSIDKESRIHHRGIQDPNHPGFPVNSMKTSTCARIAPGGIPVSLYHLLSRSYNDNHWMRVS